MPVVPPSPPPPAENLPTLEVERVRTLSTVPLFPSSTFTRFLHLLLVFVSDVPRALAFFVLSFSRPPSLPAPLRCSFRFPLLRAHALTSCRRIAALADVSLCYRT